MSKISQVVPPAEALPRLVRAGDAFHLVVDGSPYLILGIQTANSSGYPGELERTWALARKLGVNTIEIPIQWETVELEQGQLDFSVVEGLVAGARQHGLRLILAWFGGFKNGAMHFAPPWVKTDLVHYPRMINQAGEPIQALATHIEAAIAADAQAFAAFMRYLREIDEGRHTVIAVQVENEAGVLGTDRDHSESADRLFAQPVPEVVRKVFDRKEAGSWKDVFGVYADETFAAYYQALYLSRVAEAGKQEYPLPMFLNVWSDIQDGFYEPGFSHPSGGATTRMLDLYKALVPAIDWISPDIYKTSHPLYVQEATPYSRPDNPLFIPETGRSLDFCRRMFYALGDLKGIGVSVFGVEGKRGEAAPCVVPESLTDLAATYRVLSQAAPLLARAKEMGRLRSAVEEEGIATIVLPFDGYEVKVEFGPLRYGYGGTRAAGTSERSGRILIGQTGPDEFVFAGFDGVVNLRPTFGSGLAHTDFVTVEEGYYEAGTWQLNRLLSGDEIFFGVRMRNEGTVVRVRMIKY